MARKQLKKTDIEYSQEFKAELDRRYADYKSGKAKMITAEESKRRIEAIRKKKSS